MNFFIHSSVNEHLGCFNFGFLRVYAQEWDCWVWFYSQFFKESPYHLPQWLYPFTFPPTVQEHSLFSTPSPAFIVCRLFDDGHSDRCEVIPHCGFDLHFSNNELCWVSFHVFASHLYVFFGEMSVQVLSPLFDWVVCFSGIEWYKLNKLIQPLWKTVWRFLKKLGIKPPYEPAIPLLGIYPEETKIEKDTDG